AERRTVRAQWLMVAAILVIGLVGYQTIAWWRASAPSTTLSLPGAAASEAAPSSSPLAPSTPPQATRPANATARTGAPTPGDAPDDLLHFDIHPQGLCWLSATVDGSRIVYRLMQPGDQLTLDVHDEAVLRIGNPAAFGFSINGRQGRSLGAAGQPVT